MTLELCTGTSRKVIKCTAPRYTDYLMTWVQATLEDESVFPTNVGVPFPDDFDSVVKTIFRRLFRVYAHVYLAHFDQIRKESFLVKSRQRELAYCAENLKEDAHMNTSFKHFMLFVQEFDLIEARELEPLADLIQTFTSRDIQV